MIDILLQTAHNYIAQAAFGGWFSAQAIKFIWQLVRFRRLRFERLVGSGGFPSSHTSFVIATTTAIFLKNGGVSDLFVLSLVFSIVVMYDASGVRLEAGRQAQILNQIVDYFLKRNIPVVITRKEALKELLGHTPVEVFGGLILGILVAYIQFYYVYNGVI